MPPPLKPKSKLGYLSPRGGTHTTQRGKSGKGVPTDELHPFIKKVWAKQLTRLPSQVVCVKFQLVFKKGLVKVWTEVFPHLPV